MAWKFFTSTGQEKQALANAAVGSYALLQDQKTANTSGGTFTLGAWRTRDLNTEVSDTGNIVSIASNQFTLGAGTYIIKGRAPAHKVDQHQTRIQNITDATTTGVGTSEYAGSAVEAVTESQVFVVVTIAGTKTFELQHIPAATRATNGFGVPVNVATEVYSVVEIWKVA